MTLATITITARWPLSLDGLDLGMSERRSLRFSLTDQGIVRGSKLYKTFDSAALAEALGAVEAKITTTLAI